MEENKQREAAAAPVTEMTRLSSVFLLEKGELKYFTRDSSLLAAAAVCKTRRQPKIVARFLERSEKTRSVRNKA